MSDTEAQTGSNGAEEAPEPNVLAEYFKALKRFKERQAASDARVKALEEELSSVKERLSNMEKFIHTAMQVGAEMGEKEAKELLEEVGKAEAVTPDAILGAPPANGD